MGFKGIYARIAKARSQSLSQMANTLASEGLRIAKDAEATAETQKRSGNQSDAFGYAVYLDGREMRRGYANPSPVSSVPHKGWEKHGIPADTGRGYLDSFLDTYVPPKKGFHLVVVNAAYYTRILEEGAQGRPKRRLSTKYRIISQITDDMDRLAAKYGGTMTGINM